MSRLCISYAIKFCATGENERESELERGSYIRTGRRENVSANNI
jgi:hypothetical protein